MYVFSIKYNSYFPKFESVSTRKKSQNEIQKVSGAKRAFLKYLLKHRRPSERPRRDERAERLCELTFKEMLLVTSSRGTLVPMLLCPLFCL